MIYSLTANPALDRELTVPEIRLNEVLRADVVRIDCGGKGLNVSRALASLGQPSVAMGFIGGDTGRRLERELAAAGVETDFLTVGGETRTNVCIVTADSERQIKVNEPGPVVTRAEQDALLAIIDRRAQSGDWWVVSGSLPPGADSRLYARVIDIVRAKGGRTLLDTSEDALQFGCAAKPYLVKPNATEAGRLTGVDVLDAKSARAAAIELHRQGAEIAVISLGVQGALLSASTGAWFARPPAVRARNANGAGDALLAGLVYSLSRGEEFPDALRTGVACGTVAAGMNGTAVPARAEVERLASQVQVASA